MAGKEDKFMGDGGFTGKDENLDSRNYQELYWVHKSYYEQLFKHMPDGIALVDQDNKVIDVNPVFEKIFGYDKDEIIGENLDCMITTPELSKEAETLSSMAQKGMVVNRSSQRIRKDGKPVFVKITGMPLVINDKMAGGFGIYQDITEEKLAKERLEYLNNRDKLTGTYHRQYVENMIYELEKNNVPVSFILGDINDLKLVNEVFGHLEGNKVLQRTVRILKSVLPHDAIISRWSGDEFLIVLTETGELEVQQWLKKLREAFEWENINKRDKFPVILSFGYATRIGDGRPVREVLKKADDRMQRQKSLSSRRLKGASVEFLKRMMPEKCSETVEHTTRMKHIARMMGEALYLSEAALDELELIASLHDIGKIAVPENILLKEGPLDEEEWHEIKKHPEIGCRIAQSMEELRPVAEGILYHHEWINGRGYPTGLQGREIPLVARVISIVDAYEVMTRGRPYKGPVTPQNAREELKNSAGTQFDPDLVELFSEEIFPKIKEKF
ncbi:sensor domain-containing diguanylate cyclase/phosphohydrolase [Natranaerobius thermophilus]|uniref:Diguanylate cyclase and metal dependent phosphohydrolase n=1 Tax=Natranaerobius thermophilus (strain ATCC BAA-1301 / DSM 18059 / JW/NM-WN-LF) TaxID=457570 RepID=B2A818_NATTJ|nr:HD domain-containing phosphohydrolase [Natranaerobius thermophilus]ACB85790.1 diguanylate cyclase and metal dependent phosphohydrolase [Natranaerobius thermophilus JW/NM-WN-LF]